MKLSELSYSAKQKALERHAQGMDYEWWDTVYYDAKRIGALLGIDIDRIYFSGFWSQGDGASFEGSYRYAKGAVKAVRDEAPHDKELLRIAQDLQKAQSRYFYKLSAHIATSGRYSHSGTMRVTVEHSEDSYRDIGAAEDDVTQALREFADWIYRNLEKEYEYLTSEDSLSEFDYDYDDEGNII